MVNWRKTVKSLACLRVLPLALCGLLAQAPTSPAPAPKPIEQEAKPAAPRNEAEGPKGGNFSLKVQEPAVPAQAPASAPVAPAVPTVAPKPSPVVLASDLFGDSGAFSRPSEMRVTDSYILGVGDQLQLNVYGGINLEEKLEVGKGGVLVVPKVGAVNTNGISLGAAKELVRMLLSRNFSRFTMDLQVLKVRDVQVFLLGEVTKPGSYVVPSITSLVNILGLGGGPSPLGSYRQVRLMRDGRIVESVDLYELRFLGKGMKALALKDGDTIFLPLSGAKVGVEGAFRRVPEQGSLLVELLPQETLADLVQWAGGLQSMAHGKLVTLQRVDPSTGSMTVRNVAQEPARMAAVPMREGDVVRALARLDRQEGQIEVTGHVRVPGLYGYEPGMKVKDLLEANQLIMPTTYMGRGELLRTLPDMTTHLYTFEVGKALAGDPAHNLALGSRDRLEFYDLTSFRLWKRVTVLGPFTKPGVYDWHEGMRASDLIFRAGIPKINADRFYAELARTKDGKTSKVTRLDLGKLLSDERKSVVQGKDDGVDPVLEPYDQITLFEVPGFKMHRTVHISGQVLRPGVYTIEEEKFTLGALVKRAGGLTGDAMPAGGIFLRAAVKAKDLTSKDLEATGVDPNDPTTNGINEILGRLNETKRSRDGLTALQTPLLHGLVKGRLNRLVVDFEAAVRGDGRRDVELMDGDEIVIPRKVDNVYVVGEVASPFSSFVVKSGDSVSDVIALAGGLTRNADKGQIRLLKADGRILDSWVMGRRAEPGDAILVPQRLRTQSNWQDNLQALTPLALLINAVIR